VTVTDREDGSLAAGDIPTDAVAVSIDYVSKGFDFIRVVTEHESLDSSSRFAVAQALINNSDCKTCHTRDVKTVGPSFKQIADKYRGDRNAVTRLTRSVIRGSAGIWGTDNNMPAHPSITENDARTIVNFILSTGNPVQKSLPVSGSYKTQVPENDNGEGTYIIRAAYTDKGAEGIPAQTTDSVILLRSPKLIPVEADIKEGGALRDQLDEYVFLTVKPNSFIAFESVDLTGITEISLRPNWHLYDIYPGGKVEIRLGAPDGELIGATEIAPEQFNTRYRGAFGGLMKMTPEQEIRTRRYPPIDQKKFFAPGSNKNSFTIPSAATIKPINGKQDIYFVFKNDSVKREESLLPLAEIEMMNRKQSN
jgi:cytochrome c